MKAFFAAVAVLLAASAVAPIARADGPRASSGNNWPGMSDPVAASPAAAYGTQAAPASAPHYVWREGYSHGGQWQGGWERVQ